MVTGKNRKIYKAGLNAQNTTHQLSRCKRLCKSDEGFLSKKFLKKIYGVLYLHNSIKI